MIRHPEAPPPGESPEAAYNDFERRYAALDLAALAVMVGADNDDARDHFDRALSSALSDFHLQLREGNALTRRQLRAELEAVENRATALLAALNALHYDAWMEMLDGYEQRVTEDFDEERWLQEGLSFADVQWDMAADTISRLRDVAAEAREHLPPRRQGRRRDNVLPPLIEALAGIYQAHSGERAYTKYSYDPVRGEASSPFMHFVEAVLSGFAPEFRRSNNALGEAIRRTVGNRVRVNGKKG